jgi:YceI-like domain
MFTTPGSYSFGPHNATLTVRTRKTGAAAKAGHNLTMEVTSWSATLGLAEDPAAGTLALSADSGSLNVLEGTGGIHALGDEDKLGIKQTIDEEVLERTPIEFRSTSLTPAADGSGLSVQGDLELAGATVPIAFELQLDGDHLTGTATVTQTAWGIKPYSALFGTLKVADEVEVAIDATLPAA